MHYTIDAVVNLGEPCAPNARGLRKGDYHMKKKNYLGVAEDFFDP